MSVKEFTPFADDEMVFTIGAMAIENGISSVVVHGDFVVSKDPQDIEALRAFIAVLKTIEAAMVSGVSDAVCDELSAMVEEAENPFG